MGAVRRYWEIVKLIFIYVKFKYRQFKLKTNETVVIKTTYGPIKGVKRFSCWNDAFYSFEKVPFAKPPLGELRFKAPQPPENWTEVVDCTKEGPVPLQNNLLINRMEGSEDCLYLNVYTKNLLPTEPLPVMVWIYGGGFETGGASKDLYSPDYFMQKDVVLISITYRVGPFGFISFKDPSIDIPGNTGLKDQVFALKWVKENCSKFGGDPNNITVFGESAGSASTQYMTITEQTRGLFHKAILMSGSVLAPWATVSIENVTYRLAKLAGYKGSEDEQEMYQFYRNVKGIDLVRVEQKILTLEERRNRILLPFAPVIEPYVTSTCVIPEDPRIMLRKAWGNDIPIILGAVSKEGLLIYPDAKKRPELLDDLHDCEYLVPMELNLNRQSEKCKELGLRIKKLHYGDKEPTRDLLEEYMDIISYTHFWHSIHRTILSRLLYSSADSYLYRFDVNSPFFNHMRNFWCGRKVKGVCHADDLSYIFYNAMAQDLAIDSLEYKSIQRMINIFVNFAKTGNPNHECLKPLVWEPLYKEMKPFKCLNISDKLEIIDLPEADKLETWDSLYPPDKLI